MAVEHRALGFEVPGRLERRAKTGDVVETGDVLARLDRKLERARMRRSQLLVDEAARELERVRGLRGSGAASAKVLESAETALALQETELAIASQELDRRTLRAPFAGIVGETAYEPGEVVSPGAVALALLDLSSLKLELGIPSAQIAAVSVGSRVDIELPTVTDMVDNAARLEGRVTRIAPSPEPNRHLYEVEVLVPNELGRLRAGMPARARVVTRTLEEAFEIPLELIVERDGRRVVFFAVDGTAKTVDVSDADLRGDTLLLAAANVPHREIIVRGQRDLHEGERLRVDDTVLAGTKAALPTEAPQP